MFFSENRTDYRITFIRSAINPRSFRIEISLSLRGSVFLYFLSSEGFDRDSQISKMRSTKSSGNLNIRSSVERVLSLFITARA